MRPFLSVLIATFSASAVANAEPGRCDIDVSGAVTAKVTIVDPGKPPNPFGGVSAKATTDYWMTDAEMRSALSAMTGAFASTNTLFKQKGVDKVTTADIQKAAVKGATAPSTADRDKQVDEAMKKDPRLMLMILACRNESVHLTFTPANHSKYANVPFKPARYSLAPDQAAKPGDFVALVSVKDGDKSTSYRAASPGRLELSQFDAHGIKGTFSFAAEQAFVKKGDTAKTVTLKGSFSFPCLGGSVCQK
jgi:hypothetical protein